MSKLQKSAKKYNTITDDLSISQTIEQSKNWLMPGLMNCANLANTKVRKIQETAR